jgi:hypothetical protein
VYPSIGCGGCGTTACITSSVTALAAVPPSPSGEGFNAVKNKKIFPLWERFYTYYLKLNFKVFI